MDNKVMTWLIKPLLVAGRFGLGRILSASEKLMGGIARITGVSALRSFAEFLVLIQEVLEGFQKSGERITSLLQSSDTAFVLVTIPTAAAGRSAVHLDHELRALSYRVSLLVLNRCLDPRVGQDIERLPQGEARRSLETRLSREVAVTQNLERFIQRTWTVKIKDQLQDMGSLAAMLDLADQLGRTSSTSNAG
jgi:anion-transporting  ArsA/GET3 family ATPase